MHDLDLGHFERRRQQIIHEGLGDHLALIVIDEFLEQGGADAVRDAAERHAFDDVRIDHRAAVMADDIALDLRRAEIGIDREQHDVEFERVARIHLHPAVRRRQRAAGRHLIDVIGLQPRLEALRQQMPVAVRDRDEVEPGQAAVAF